MIPSNQSEGSHLRTPEMDLVARCQAGALDAFEQLYRQHSRRLYGLTYRMVGTRADADELLQEIFLLAYRKLGTFRGESSLGTWLHRLAMNLCLDHLRSKRAKVDQLTDPLEENPRDDTLRSRERSGELMAERLDLERAIGQLPESYRAAFLLHDVEGFEHHEIGTILGIAEGTSKSLVHKARRRLRTLLTGTEVQRTPALAPR
jgi:RNA polymerase sigma-70 factor, ECF subfamily